VTGHLEHAEGAASPMLLSALDQGEPRELAFSAIESVRHEILRRLDQKALPT